MNITGKYFYGNEISKYGQENGYLDYATLAKAFDAVLNNEIIRHGEWEQVSGFIDHSEEIDELREQIEALEEARKEDEDILDAHHRSKLPYFPVSLENKLEESYREESEKIMELQDRLYELEHEEDSREVFQWYIVSTAGKELLEEIGEIVYYNEEMDMYLWGVTHYGTSWDYVLTDVRCNTGN